MSTRIEKDFYFQCATHFEGKFYINFYDITASMIVETESIREQNVAMERAEYFLSNVLENSIFVHQSETAVIENYEKAGIKVCTTPEEPYDQIVSMILLLKLNAIMEGRLSITDLIMGSKLSNGVRFSVVPEIAENIFHGNHWWNEPCTIMKDTTKPPKRREKIVKLFNDEWAEIGLTWKEKSKNSDKVVVLEPEK
jgi:hypothetical protein